MFRSYVLEKIAKHLAAMRIFSTNTVILIYHFSTNRSQDIFEKCVGQKM